MTLSDMLSRVWHLLHEDPPDSGTPYMQLADLQNRTWHLLREDGPDTGYPIPTTGDFPQSVVTRDLNIAQAEFISESGVTYIGSPIMAAQTDVPVIPPQYNMALVYRVLGDYWLRKQDEAQAKSYMERYASFLARASTGQGNFTATTITRDLNIALAQFLSETGFSPDLTDRMDTFPVLPVLDHPVPLGLVSLHQIDYTPAGQQLYTINGLSMSEWNRDIGGVLPPIFGYPLTYREPYAGYVRLYPQPGQGNAVGNGAGTIILSGAPTIGDLTHIVVTNGSQTVTTANYATTATDTTTTIAVQLMTKLNQSSAVTGVGAFLSPSSTISNQVNITSLVAPGTSITYEVVTTSTTMSATPYAPANLLPNGDAITFYYSTTGVILVNLGDVPNIPPAFHMNLVYRVLGDYWLRKKDPEQAKEYMARYEIGVAKAKAYTFDSKRSTQPTIAGEDSDGYSDFVAGGF